MLELGGTDSIGQFLTAIDDGLGHSQKEGDYDAALGDVMLSR